MSTESDDREWRDPNNWNAGVYSAANDPRVMVPKRIPGLGWTLNFARPESRRLVVVTFLTYGFVFATIAIAFLAAMWLAH